MAFLNKLIPLAVCLFAAHTQVQASVVKAIGFGELSRSADAVVAGRIVSAESRVDPASGHVFTRLRLFLSDSVGATDGQREFSFEIRGGETATIEQHVVGMPKFRSGQSVALFLRLFPGTDRALPIGLWQGVFYLEQDAVRGEFTVRDAFGRDIVGLREGSALRAIAKETAAAGGSKPMGLSDFMEAVRSFRSPSAP